MKKILLLLLFVFSFSTYAQPPLGLLNPYSLCDNDSNPNDGYTTFDLTSTDPIGTLGLNPTIYSVTFHSSVMDANDNVNVISNPSAYTNVVSNYQIIGVRFLNSSNNEVNVSGMEIIVSPLPNAGTDGNITVCETSSTTIDLYSLIIGEQSGGIWTSIIGSGGTFNAAAGTYIPSVGATTSIFTYTILSEGCGINDSSIAAVYVTPQPNAGIDGNLIICDTNPTTIDLYSLIAGEQAGGVWSRLSGSGGTFNAAAGTFSASIGATTSSFQYTINGSAPCINDSSMAAILINCNPPPVCGSIFTDEGGITANYQNNSNQTTTICPTGPGDAVTVTFTSFNTEVLYDAMYVYNGAVAIPSQQILSANPVGNVPGGIAGGFWGDTIPGPFTSTSQNGCLTFVFRSDALNTLEGWVANISCTTVVCETPTVLTVTNITSTSVVLNWNNPSGTNAWEVLVLPQGSPIPTASSSGNYYGQILPYIVTGLSPDICYTAYVRSLCSLPSEWSSPLDFCMFNCENNASCPESLALIAFLDSNSNGVKDTGEQNFNQGNFVYQVNDSGDNLYGTSNSDFYYIFDSNPANSYDINFTINSELSAYYTSAVSFTNVTLPSGSGSNYLYFPVVNILPHVDANVSLSPYGQPRPGFMYNNTIYYRNNGLQTIANGTLTFTKGSNVSITYVSQLGVTMTSTGFTYTFTNLLPNESRYINVDLLVPTIPTVNLGDLVTNSVTVQITNDINLSNNTASLTQTIVGSYDPNDKMESHGGKIVHADFTSNDYLYYTIQFENTGTASAEFIRVEDALDNQLDESTFEMLNASHTVNTKRVGNQLTWRFYTINLPPTVTNPNESHGFVHFRIKPKAGYAVGDIIPNTASIYFDYNPAIVTNTFNTEFFTSLNSPSFSNNEFQLYPNPAKGIVLISLNNNQFIDKVIFYDLEGKKIKSLSNVNTFQTNVDVSTLAKGIYFVEITTENHFKQTKKLIIQ